MLISQTNLQLKLPSRDRIHKILLLNSQTILVQKLHSLAFYSLDYSSPKLSSTSLSSIYCQHKEILTIHISSLAEAVRAKIQKQSQQSNEKQSLKQTGMKQSEIVQQQDQILELCYHPFHNILYILSHNIGSNLSSNGSVKSNNKQPNWEFYALGMGAINEWMHEKGKEKGQCKWQKSVMLLQSQQKNMSKYKKMQLSPRIIGLTSGSYVVLLRQFYNDSMVNVYKLLTQPQQLPFQAPTLTASFYINQQNMSQFTSSSLVSYRAQFSQMLKFFIFNIQELKPVSNPYRIEGDRSGIILSICHFPFFMGHHPYGKQAEGLACSFALICVNNKNRSISYLIYDMENKEIRGQYFVPDALIFKVFGFSWGEAQRPRQGQGQGQEQMEGQRKQHYESGEIGICCLERKDGQLTIAWDIFDMHAIIDTNHPQQIQSPKSLTYPALNPLECWQQIPLFPHSPHFHCSLSSPQLHILNYIQPIHSQQTLLVNLYRFVSKKQLIVYLLEEMGFGEDVCTGVIGILG